VSCVRLTVVRQSSAVNTGTAGIWESEGSLLRLARIVKDVDDRQSAHPFSGRAITLMRKPLDGNRRPWLQTQGNVGSVFMKTCAIEMGPLTLFFVRREPTPGRGLGSRLSGWPGMGLPCWSSTVLRMVR